MNGGSAINLIILYLFIYLLPLFIKTNDFSVKNDIYKNNLDTRTKNEYLLHTPCCENIHDFMERNNLDELPK